MGISFFRDTIYADLTLINNEEFFEVFPIDMPYVDFVVKF